MAVIYTSENECDSIASISNIEMKKIRGQGYNILRRIKALLCYAGS